MTEKKFYKIIKKLQSKLNWANFWSNDEKAGLIKKVINVTCKTYLKNGFSWSYRWERGKGGKISINGEFGEFNDNSFSPEGKKLFDAVYDWTLITK